MNLCENNETEYNNSMKLCDKDSTASDDDDELFLNQLFTDDTTSSQSINNGLDAVDFYMDQNTEIFMANYMNTVYSIGFLDLSDDEYSHFLTNEVNVKLEIDPEHIYIQHNKINIKRICDYEIPSNEFSYLWNDSFDFDRIDFSTTFPLIAKYKSDFYFVNDNLKDFYVNLLERTRKNAGCAIRIEKSRLIVDGDKQKLDIHPFFTQKNQRIMTLTSHQKSKSIVNASNVGFHRYLVGNVPCKLVLVDPKLIKSLKSIEIYVYEEGERLQNAQVSSEICDQAQNGNIDDTENVDDSEYNAEDDEFFKQLFTDTQIAPNPLDTNNRCDGDDKTDCEFHKTVKFFVNTITSKIEAEYDGSEYAIGFLDLTQEEQAHMAMIKWTVELTIECKHIWIHCNKFHIRRINSPFDQIVCIQFSPDLWPLMVKFYNKIYLVGEKLSNEYLDVLASTQKQMSTAIFLNEKYLKIDNVENTLDIHDFVELKNKNTVYLDSNMLKSNELVGTYFSNEYKRYAVVNNTCLEIDLELMQTSMCEGIYVYDKEAEFSFINFKTVHQSKKSKRQSRKNQSIRQQYDKNSMKLPHKISVVKKSRMLNDPYVKYRIMLVLLEKFKCLFFICTHLCSWFYPLRALPLPHYLVPKNVRFVIEQRTLWSE